MNAAKKAITKMPLRTIKNGDKVQCFISTVDNGNILMT